MAVGVTMNGAGRVQNCSTLWPGLAVAPSTDDYPRPRLPPRAVSWI